MLAQKLGNNGEKKTKKQREVLFNPPTRRRCTKQKKGERDGERDGERESALATLKNSKTE